MTFDLRVGSLLSINHWKGFSRQITIDLKYLPIRSKWGSHCSQKLVVQFLFIFFVGGRLKLCHAPEKSHYSVVFCVFEMWRCIPMPNLTSLTVFENLRFSDPKNHARVRLRYLSTCPGLSISDFNETCIIFFVLVPLTCF